VANVLYKIVNLVNDKFYVGSTTNQRERFRAHRNKLRRGVHHCRHLQAAWNKYSEEKFAFVALRTFEDIDAMHATENSWLVEHVGKEHCYNSGTAVKSPMLGRTQEKHPNFGKPVTEEQRAQISETLKEFYAADYNNHPRVGKLHTEETKAKISASKKANPTRYWEGKQRSQETRDKIGDTQRGVAKPVGRKVSPEGLAKIQANIDLGLSHMHWLGRKHTEESKLKMSKPVFALPDGVLFSSLTATAQHYGVKMPTIRRSIMSGKPISRGKLTGHSFRYADRDGAAVA